MIDTYSETRVVIAPSGELLLALPIYANQNGLLFDSSDLKKITKSKDLPLNCSVGFYEQMGYIIYHPEQPYTFYINSLELFKDLGKL